MKLAVCVQTDEVPKTLPVALLSGPFAERARKAAGLGFDGLELMVVDPGALDAAAVRATLAANGLEAAAIGTGGIAFSTGLTLVHPDPDVARAARSRLLASIEFAAGVGAPLVTIGSFRGRLAPAGPGARIQLAELLAGAARHAATVGVGLAFEAGNRYELDFVNNATEGLAFINEIGEPALGLLLDTFHVNIEECSWTEPFARALGLGKLFHVHLGDNNRLPPGRGLIDFPAIVATLRAGGYSGYLSAELLARPDPDTAAQETFSYMHLLLEG